MNEYGNNETNLNKNYYFLKKNRQRGFNEKNKKQMLR